MRVIERSATVFAVLFWLVLGPAIDAQAYETVHQDALIGGQPPSSGVPVAACTDSWFAQKPYGIRDATSDQTYFTNTQQLGGLLAVAAIPAIQDAFGTWNDGLNDCLLVPTSTFDFTRAAETSTFPSLFLSSPQRDGINEVAFIDMQGVSGVDPLAVGAIRIVRDDLSPGVVLEFDIALDTNKVWSTSGLPGAYDVQGAVTHLAGIALGLSSTAALGHANLSMFGVIWPGDTAKRTLGLGDVRGLEAQSANRPV